MENRLKKLFDYQKFEQNSALQDVIDSVHARYAKRELDFDQMETVYAAGQPTAKTRKKKERKDEA